MALWLGKKRGARFGSVGASLERRIVVTALAVQLFSTVTILSLILSPLILFLTSFLLRLLITLLVTEGIRADLAICDSA